MILDFLSHPYSTPTGLIGQGGYFFLQIFKPAGKAGSFAMTWFLSQDSILITYSTCSSFDPSASSGLSLRQAQTDTMLILRQAQDDTRLCYPESAEGWECDNWTRASISFLIRASFFARLQPLICFSALIASLISEYLCEYISWTGNLLLV